MQSGPPGTGKTYVGLKIVETLLANLYNVGTCRPLFGKGNEFSSHRSVRKSSDIDLKKIEQQPLQSHTMKKPILVVCYTNHALDQFLEGILDFCPSGNLMSKDVFHKN